MKIFGAITRFFVAIALAASVVTVVVVIGTNWIVFDYLKSGLAFALPAYAGVDPQLATAAGWVIAIAGAWPLSLWLLKLAMGRASLSSVVTAVTAATAVGGGYVFATSDWLFDARGQPLAYICPAVVPGQRPRVQRQSADHQLGGVCPVVDRDIAKVLGPLLQNGTAPAEFQLPASGEVRLHDPRNGAPLVWAGSPRDGDSVTALYSGPGFDPIVANTLLRPATREDLRVVMRALDLKTKAEALRKAAHQKQINEAVVAAVEREQANARLREREAADQHARELAQRETAVRELAQQAASAREQLQREAAAREQAQRNEADREQSVRASQQQTIEAERVSQAAADVAVVRRAALPDWRLFFRHDLNADTLLVLTGAAIDAREEQTIANKVLPPWTTYYKSSRAATSAFYEALDIHRILWRDLSSMTRVAWHPALRNVVFVHIVGRAPDGSPQFASIRTRLQGPLPALSTAADWS